MRARSPKTTAVRPGISTGARLEEVRDVHPRRARISSAADRCHSAPCWRAELAAQLELLLLHVLGDLGRALDEAGDLLHVLVEEHEHRDRPEDPAVQVLVHEVRVLVAEEHAHLDVRSALDHPREHREVGQGVPAPVLGDDEDVELLARGPRTTARSWGVTCVAAKRLQELVLVGGHLVEVLLERHALCEALLGDHRTRSPSSRVCLAIGGVSGTCRGRSWPAGPPSAPAALPAPRSVTTPFVGSPSSGNTYTLRAARRPSSWTSGVRSFWTKRRLDLAAVHHAGPAGRSARSSARARRAS